MKTEDQLLISYMYQQGYTEEDMYDERILLIVRFSLDFRMFHFKYEFKPLIDSLVETFQNMVAGINETIQPIVNWMEGLRKGPSISHTITYSKNRLRLIDQVDNRKPRHLVRKIIR